MIKYSKGMSFLWDLVDYSGGEFSFETELAVATKFYY